MCAFVYFIKPKQDNQVYNDTQLEIENSSIYTYLSETAS